MLLKSQFTVEQDSKIANNAGRLDGCRAHHERAVGHRSRRQSYDLISNFQDGGHRVFARQKLTITPPY